MSKNNAPSIPNYLCFTALEDGTFSFKIGSSNTTTNIKYIEYSLDGITWTRTDNVADTEVIITTPTISAGNCVYWRAKATKYGINNGYTEVQRCYFSSTGRFNVSGKLASMIKDDSSFETLTAHSSSYVFNYLFYNCTGLVSAKDLELLSITYSYANYAPYYSFMRGCTSLIDAPSLANLDICPTNSFAYMFDGCTSLVTPPELPKNRTLRGSCFAYMFQNCSSLTSAPQLPYTTLADSCFRNMFSGCSSLISVQESLPATTGTSRCYQQMFLKCTSLTTAPNIALTSLNTYSIYGMFRGCTSLSTFPTLVFTSTNTSSCEGMFYGCKLMTKSPILKPAVVSMTAYKELFRTNSNLAHITMLATDVSATNCLLNWVNGVKSSGVFVKHINATWTNSGNSGVPNNWTVIYYDPADEKFYTNQQKTQECDEYGNAI